MSLEVLVPRPEPRPPRLDPHVLAAILLVLIIYLVGACHAFAQPSVFEPMPPASTSSTVGLLTNIQGSVTIPMGAWFSNNVADGASLTAASYESVTNAGDGYGFADTVTNVIRSRFALPWDWDGSAVKVGIRALCSGTNASAGGPTNVVFAIRAASFGNGDRVDSPTWGTAAWTTNNIGTNAFAEHLAVTGSLTVNNSASSAKSILWELQRLGSQAGDTLTNSTLYVTEVQVFYKRALTTTAPSSTP